MSLTLFDSGLRMRRFIRSSLARVAMVLGLTLAISACAYDAPYYNGHNGYSTYSGNHYRDYDRGRYDRNYRTHRPDWRAQARHREAQRREAQRRHRSQAQRHHYKARGNHHSRPTARPSQKHGHATPHRPQRHDARHRP